MCSEAEIKIIKDLKSDDKSFQKIADITKLKRSFEKLRIKRQVAQYKKSKERVNATKIKRSCYFFLKSNTQSNNMFSLVK